MSTAIPPQPKGKVAPLKRIELAFKRLVFFPISLMLRDGDKSKKPPSRESVKRILLLRPETKIGDMVISLPLMKHLRESWPKAEIYIFCSRRNAGVIYGDSTLDGIFHYDKNLFKDILEVRKIRKLQCDVILDLLYHDSLTTLILSQTSARHAYRIGGGKRRFARYYDHSAPWAHDHIIDCTLSLLEPLGIDISHAKRQIPLSIDSSCRERARGAVARLKSHSAILMGMNVSAGTASRTWGDDKITALVENTIQSHSGIGVVILGTPIERKRFEILSVKHPERVVVPSSGNSIQDAAALISEVDFVVSPDTAMVHIARSQGKPVVGLYTGNISNRLKFQPWGDGNMVVIAQTQEDIHDITVAQVASAVQEMIGKLTKVETQST